MAERRFPRPDGDFNAWQANYVAAVQDWFNTQGTSSPLLDAAVNAQKEWDIAYPAHIAAQAAAQGARAEKVQAREIFERAIRPLTNFLQGDPAVTDADRATFGITVRDTEGTRAATPTTRPQAVVQAGQRLTHTLRLSDEATPTRRARPKGVLGAEVWVKLVDAGTPAPTDPAALSFLTMATKPSIRADFNSGDGGKTAVYMLRWVNTRGEKGPWSEVTTATVAA